MSETKEVESPCPFQTPGCPGFTSNAQMGDLCDGCYEGRRSIGERE